jgi:hypothetical protein
LKKEFKLVSCKFNQINQIIQLFVRNDKAMYSDKFKSSENISSSALPLIKLTRWRYKHYACPVYQLPNGDLVMSDRQAAVPLGQSKENTKAFFQTYKLDTITIQLPNRKIISAYSLPTVAIYWRYLLESHLIPQRLIDKFDWLELIDSLQQAHQQSHNNEKQLITPKVTQSDQSRKEHLIPVHSIALKLQKKLQLEILVLPDQEYRISYESGLEVIGAYQGWLQELPNSPNQLKTLSTKGFSGLSKTCLINTEEETKTVESLSLNDWLTVWEVFAYHGNSKAAAVLKACAKENIPDRVMAATKPYSR